VLSDELFVLTIYFERSLGINLILILKKELVIYKSLSLNAGISMLAIGFLLIFRRVF